MGYKCNFEYIYIFILNKGGVKYIAGKLHSYFSNKKTKLRAYKKFILCRVFILLNTL